MLARSRSAGGTPMTMITSFWVGFRKSRYSTRRNSAEIRFDRSPVLSAIKTDDRFCPAPFRSSFGATCLANEHQCSLFFPLSCRWRSRASKLLATPKETLFRMSPSVRCHHPRLLLPLAGLPLAIRRRLVSCKCWVYLQLCPPRRKHHRRSRLSRLTRFLT
jgi:hypothetical protein